MKNFNEWREDEQKQEADVTEFLVVCIFIILGMMSIAA